MANKSVYNFVPAPKENEVFKPKWAKYISQDIPFEDAQSGEIEIELEALTPIFIRNGQKKEANDNSFSHYIDNNRKKQYFIPGTSLKGMVRNVLEILSYSKLNKKLVDDHRYSYRDLRRNSLYMNNYDARNVLCGWLTEKDGKWKIEDCGKPYLISHYEIDYALDLDENSGIEFTYCTENKRPISRDAKSKYKFLQSLNEFHKIPFNANHSELTKKQKMRNIVLFDEYSDTEGYLVLTGQVGKKDYNKTHGGKYHEFLFPILEVSQPLEVSDDIQKDFRFIYKERANDESTDWKFWRKKLAQGQKVPVFFNKDNKGNVKHLGLAYMYKLPYKNSIHEVCPIKEYKDDIDFVETLFGYTNNKKSLKGRVSFGHGKAITTCQELEEEVSLVLGGPKASFYPYYLEQNKRDEYVTYEDDNATLRGFKRYPTRGELMTTSNGDDKNENKNVKTSFKPLKEGVTFTSKIRFFNLKKEELGALLSALTFHNKENCYHNLGMAKPFGYGKVALKIKHIKVDGKKVEPRDYISSFETIMKSKINNWEESKPLQELFAMASNTNDAILGYMGLKDFVKAKKPGQQLPDFTKIKK